MLTSNFHFDRPTLNLISSPSDQIYCFANIFPLIIVTGSVYDQFIFKATFYELLWNELKIDFFVSDTCQEHFENIHDLKQKFHNLKWK